MTRQNYSREANVTITHDTMANQMALYDALPSELKQLYDQAPVPIDLRQFWAAIRKFGDQSPALIYAAILRDFPGWAPITAKRKRRR